MSPELIAQIPGAAELAAWFGRFPRFHDSNVYDFTLKGDGSGHFRMDGWNMTSETDAKGYFILEKHFTAVIAFTDATAVSFQDFLPGCAILSDFRISQEADGFKIEFDSSYGFTGWLKAAAIEVTFQPGKAA
ncbi:MAG TPA: hypothetical protein VGG48_08305 [Rhizomicrobium sp.]|jgi:hypothetical protein